MKGSRITSLLIGTAAASLMLSTGVNAQQSTTTAASGSGASSDLELQEVVVTATRQAEGVAVHDVPLTVTAVTGQEMQSEGLKRVEDLAREVPALLISGSNSGAGGGGGIAGSYSSSVQVAIRGITSSVGGAAPTTGIYIDDIPLQLRAGGGAGGEALPLLFDLARVEVLKGPQGTLYGGSSEGGTVRFITEQPNFDRDAFAAQAEGSKTEGSNNGGYEYGLSAGAPLIDDRLAVHVSGLFRHDSGYLNHISQFTGDTLASDTNDANHEAIHAIVDLKVTDQFLVSASYLWQYEDYADTDNYWLNMPQYQATTGPGATLHTYGPYGMFGPFNSGSNTNVGQNFYTSDAQIAPILQPHSQSMNLPSLTLDWHPDWFDVKSVTSYNRTRDNSHFNAGFTDLEGQAGGTFGPNNQLPAGSPYVANLPVYSSLINGLSNIGTTTEELRFSSASANSPLSWVGGVFYALSNETSGTVLTANFADAQAALINGISQSHPPIINLDIPGNSNETQKAIFGQIDYLFFDHLKATVGLRYSQDELSYVNFIGGALFGFPPGLIVPSEIGKLSSSATTPKFGLQYIVDPNTNYYVTVSQGYRPGGLNGVLSPQCTAAAERLGIVSASSPNPSNAFATFADDKLWSYEAGGKFKPWGGRASINASVFYIDWSKVQTPIGDALVCGNSPAINAGTEISEGAELEASVVVVSGLTTTLRAGYTNAHYTDALKLGPVTLIDEGDRAPYSPRVQGDLAVEYRFPVANYKAFVRGDWSYQSDVVTGPGPGTPGYAPDQNSLPSAGFGNARVGVDIEKMEVSAFVNNFTNSEDLLFRGGFAGGPGPVNCANAACTSYRAFEEGGTAATYRPRTIGLDFNYRY